MQPDDTVHFNTTNRQRDKKCIGSNTTPVHHQYTMPPVGCALIQLLIRSVLTERVFVAQVLTDVGLVERDDALRVELAALGSRLGSDAEAERYVRHAEHHHTLRAPNDHTRS
eukprot:6180469-Pleurochrysis_carterae.AAC.1